MKSPARPLIPQRSRRGFGLEPVPIQQDRVMNGKAVLPEPSTHQSLISTAPTGVSLIYSPSLPVALSGVSVHATIAIVRSEVES